MNSFEVFANNDIWMEGCGESGIKIDAFTETGAIFRQIVRKQFTHTCKVKGAVSMD